MIEKTNESTKAFVWKLIALFSIYYVTAWCGLKIGAVSTYATPIWPPTGIALAALLISGFRLWPAITFAAILVNWNTGAPFHLAVGMGAGNTLEAVVGAYLLRKVNFRNSLDRVQSVFALLLIGAVFSTLISATIGTLCLLLGGLLTREAYFKTWITWWYGDLMGDMLVAPIFLVWSSGIDWKKIKMRRIAESAGIIFFVAACSLLIFSNGPLSNELLYPRPYLIFPVMMVVALRLGTRGAVTGNLVVSAILIWLTATQQSRFWTGSLPTSIFQAQIFLSILVVSKMVLAASAAEREYLFKQTREAVIARDEFLSIASHELKTPLTALSLQLNIFSRGIQPGLGDNQEEVTISKQLLKIASGAEAQSKKLAALLDELLDLTRIRLGRLQLAKEYVDLSNLAKEVVKRFKIETAQKDISIALESEPDLIGYWDPIRVEQIISNLVSNAIKYGEAKPISVKVEKNISTKTAHIVVSDHGMGIPRDMLEVIFERFERGGIAGRKISGLGLGLYICRQIAQAHGGSIRVKSKVGVGSTFTVDLPLK